MITTQGGMMEDIKPKRIKKCAYCQKPLVETAQGFTHEQEFCDLKCHNLWKSSQNTTSDVLNRQKGMLERMREETKNP